jgi:hypothetical protein
VILTEMFRAVSSFPLRELRDHTSPFFILTFQGSHLILHHSHLSGVAPHHSSSSPPFRDRILSFFITSTFQGSLLTILHHPHLSGIATHHSSLSPPLIYNPHHGAKSVRTVFSLVFQDFLFLVDGITKPALLHKLCYVLQSVSLITYKSIRFTR